MERIKLLIRENLIKLKRTGFFAIFLSNVFAKGLTFLGGVVLVRILSKSDYGIYTDVLNNYGILFILSDFGCTVAMMQYRSEFYYDSEKSNAYFTKSFVYGMLFTGCASLLILFSPLFYPFKNSESIKLTQSLFLLPFFSTANGLLEANLRVLLETKKFALLNILHTFIHYGLILPFSYFLSLNGAVMANYAIAICLLIVSLILSRGCISFDWKRDVLTRGEKKEFLKYALASQLNSSIGGMLNLFDIFLISLIVVNSTSIASYKVASTIPQALLFIPTSVVIYIIPYFARNLSNKEWVGRNYKKVLLLNMIINGGITMILVLSSSVLIPLVFGNQYEDAVLCFIILMLAFFFNGSFYIPSANIIYTQHKVKVNIIITILANAVNCITDIILIKALGSVGAAYSTLIVSFVSAMVCVGYMIFLYSKSS